MFVVDRRELERDTLAAARGLLGARLVREDASGRRTGRIVELEAYLGRDDRASHARFGPTPRNRVMFGPPGIAYVYLVYGMYDCLNIVTGPDGEPAALLVRAVEPLEGLELMRAGRLAVRRARRRAVAAPSEPAGHEVTRVAALPDHRLASGPGLVAAAFGIDVGWTGTDLCRADGPLRLERPGPAESPPEVRTTPRIGVGYAGEPWTDRPWRFVVAGHRSVSGPAALR